MAFLGSGKIAIVATALLAFMAGPISTSSAEPTTRFIPVELWTGGAWNAAAELRMPSVDVTFGKHNHKRIRGPIDWTRPGTGEILKIYERTNRNKTQLFALRRDGQGLGRAYDSRYDRNCIDAIKFPLGVWKQGETRKFTFRCGRKTREVSLTILEIDFSHDGNAHSLKYRWVADGGTKRGTNNIYTYSPKLGMVDVEQN
jgi:hypothetical protein